MIARRAWCPAVEAQRLGASYLQKSEVNPGSDVKKVLREGHFPFQAQESLPTFLMVSWGTG